MFYAEKNVFAHNHWCIIKVVMVIKKWNGFCYEIFSICFLCFFFPIIKPWKQHKNENHYLERRVFRNQTPKKEGVGRVGLHLTVGLFLLLTFCNTVHAFFHTHRHQQAPPLPVLCMKWGLCWHVGGHTKHHLAPVICHIKAFLELNQLAVICQSEM